MNRPSFSCTPCTIVIQVSAGTTYLRDFGVCKVEHVDESGGRVDDEEDSQRKGEDGTQARLVRALAFVVDPDRLSVRVPGDQGLAESLHSEI